jgi:hypothetical protein
VKFRPKLKAERSWRVIFSKGLKAFGAALSSGWNVGGASYADLTGFERLIELMKVHEGETPEATSKWLREAMAQNR